MITNRPSSDLLTAADALAYRFAEVIRMDREAYDAITRDFGTDSESQFPALEAENKRVLENYRLARLSEIFPVSQ